MHRAASLGLVVSKPYHIATRYDLIVDARGNLWRVQVKSTTTFGNDKYVVGLGSGGYTAGEVDLLAVLVVPENAWYLIPIEEASGRSQLYLMGRRTRGRGGLERFREKWQVLTRHKLPRRALTKLLSRLDDVL